MTAGIGKMVKGSSTYQAALLIYNQGPILDDHLFVRIDYGSTRYARQKLLKRGVDSGWLTHDDIGMVGITLKARAQIAELMQSKEGKKYQGIPAESRSINLLHRPAYQPAKRVIRPDVPEWSKRPDGFRFHTVA